MNVTETSSGELTREFTVQVPREDIDKAVDNRLQELRGQINLPGFRPGKVPLSIMRQRYGKSVMGEVLEGLVGHSSQHALQERNLRPAQQPDIEVTKFDEDSDLEYKMTVEVLPEIEPMDLSSISIERPVAEPDEEKVDEALERVREQNAEAVPLEEDRPVADGDQIAIDFKGTVDGEEREGMQGEDMTLILGTGQLIPGFEEQLVGAEKGETRNVTVTFPENYQAADLAGKEAVFEVTVKDVQALEKPALDDALAEKMGMQSFDELRDKVRQRMQQELNDLSRAKAKRALLDVLAENHDFAVPEGMVNSEFETIWQSVEQEKEAGRLSEEEMAKSDEALRADYRSIAERRVRLGLLLTTIGERNSIQISDEEVNRAIAQQAMQYPQQAQQIFEYYQNNPQALDSIKAPIYEEKVVDYILEVASVTERTVTADELAEDPDSAEAEA